MSQTIYRRKAILTRTRKALDAFYVLQKIDWDYDVRATLERILAQALEEIEFEGGKHIERALLIIQTSATGALEVQAGWKTEDIDLSFSRTVVQQTIETGEAILCENATDDPRFMEAESIKKLETLSLVSVPLKFENRSAGALYIESKSPGNRFTEEDLEFLGEFTDTIAPFLKAGLVHHGHLQELRELREQIGDRYRFNNIIGRSETMAAVFDLVRIASGVDRTALLTGESGCGKELIANAIHYNGPRRDRPFVIVDCSSLSEHLLESELFGHRRGAFTGASSDKVGAFEEAHTGTIFLDEINDASKPLQQKLRRVLQEGEIKRVGENIVRRVDVRIICATNRNIPKLVEDGSFIRDLYFRINKFPIQVPTLRERREDIPLLVEHFLQSAAEHSQRPQKEIASEALARLVERDWAENNVRELRNTVELAFDLSSGPRIGASDLERVFRVQRGDNYSREATSPSDPEPQNRNGALVSVSRENFQRLLDSVDRSDTTPPKDEAPFYRIQLEVAARAIVEGLRSAKWKLRPAARLLGISPTKLRCVLKEFLENTLQETGGSIEKTAEHVDIPVAFLTKKAKDLGLNP